MSFSDHIIAGFIKAAVETGIKPPMPELPPAPAAPRPATAPAIPAESHAGWQLKGLSEGGGKGSYTYQSPDQQYHTTNQLYSDAESKPAMYNRMNVTEPTPVSERRNLPGSQLSQAFNESAPSQPASTSQSASASPTDSQLAEPSNPWNNGTPKTPYTDVNQYYTPENLSHILPYLPELRQRNPQLAQQLTQFIKQHFPHSGLDSYL